MSPRVDIGVFAHNEAAGIEATLRSLVSQDIYAGGAARLVVLANGCSDDTADVARGIGHPALLVQDLPESGKSRTWNRFVHQISDRAADVLIFVDADILLPDQGTLRRLAQGLAQDPALFALSSQPFKDISLNPAGLSLTERLIAASAGGLDDWTRALCGQLYAMPAPRARQFHLPIGLPVEDGFLRAMILTDHLCATEDFARLGGGAGLRHIYGSERRLGALIAHQQRIVIGSAINAAIFAALSHLPPEDRAGELQSAMRDEGWLPAVLGAELPRWPFGYVPPHFAVKRLTRLFEPGQSRSAKRVLTAFAGSFFDAIVYILAQIKMARGTGAGHW